MNKILIIYALVLMVSGLQAQKKSFTIPFTNNVDAKSIEIEIANGDIEVIGTDRTDVLVEYEVSSNKNHSGKGENTMKNGMKKISSGGASLEAKEKNNHVRIFSKHFGNKIKLKVEVPRKISVQVQKNMGDEILIEHIDGDVNAETNIGNVRVLHIKGVVNASSNTGKLVIVIDELKDPKAMQFYNTTGDIDLTLPTIGALTFKMKTDWGDIYSDIDLKMDTSPLKIDKSRTEDGTYKVITDNYTKGSIGIGGPEITLNTKMGSIYLRGLQ